MRNPIVLVLTALVAVVVAAGAGLDSAPATAAAPSPLAGLDRTFRGLLPATRCAEAAPRVAGAKRARAAALVGARTAAPKALARKKAAMRRAIAALRRAKADCATAAAPGGGDTPSPGGGPPPATTPAPPTPPPAPPGTQTIALHVAGGTTVRYTETSATATAGALHLTLENASSLQHFVGVRTAPGQPTLGESPLSAAGGSTALDITLPAGAYQVFCRNNGHDALGMVIPLTVTG